MTGDAIGFLLLSASSETKCASTSSFDVLRCTGVSAVFLLYHAVTTTEAVEMFAVRKHSTC